LTSVYSPTGIMARILEILVTSGGTIKDADLFELLRRDYNITFQDFIKFLMVLEIRGFVSVTASRENIRVISVTRYGKEQLGIKD